MALGSMSLNIDHGQLVEPMELMNDNWLVIYQKMNQQLEKFQQLLQVKDPAKIWILHLLSLVLLL